jgi:alkanesulfonate monooxygenase SsuD/methylene tetrahydromethanopterin reductase-like flavin-dependent oxidoreductase (luciferase family)
MQQEEEEKHKTGDSTAPARTIGERVSVYIGASNTVDVISRIREAEQMGVKQAWMAMGGAGFADIPTVLAVAASSTERIKLGTAVVAAPTRHPLVLAQQALAFHDLAPERLILGIGSGNPLFLEGHYGLKQQAPLRSLKEYLAVLRGILWDGKVDYHGEFFQVVDSVTRTAPMPLAISALGLKAFRLAGEVADGALASLCPVPYLLEQALPALRAGAEEKGRTTPPIIASFPIALSTDEAAVNAAVCPLIQQLALASGHANMYAQAGWAAAVQGDEKALRALAKELVISGDEATVRDRMHALLASGVDELLLLGIPIKDEAAERKELFRLIGSL